MLADKFGGMAKPLNQLQCALLEADILISSTGSTDFVIDLELMQFVEKLRKGKPLFMVDIAVPRDMDPRIGDLQNVFLYDIDDMQGIVEANLAERERAAKQIAGMIELEAEQFNDWLGTLGVVPVISALREKALGIQAETMESIENKMPDLTDREKKILNKHTKSIINQLLKEPILQAKEMGTAKKSREQLELFMQIFGIEDEVEEQREKQALATRQKAERVRLEKQQEALQGQENPGYTV